EAQAPAGFDFLSVDVEGHELEVLGGFDFARWRPRLILLEDHVGDLERHRFLKAPGYRLIRRYENNGWELPRPPAGPATSRGRRRGGRLFENILPPCRSASPATRRGGRAGSCGRGSRPPIESGVLGGVRIRWGPAARCGSPHAPAPRLRSAGRNTIREASHR